MAETPAMLRTRMMKTWDVRVATSLSDQECDSDANFPLTVNIGRPPLTQASLVQNRGEIHEWITSWKSIQDAGDVRFETAQKRRVGNITFPADITFEDIDCLALFLGRQAQKDLSAARKSLKVLSSIDNRLKKMAPHWRKLAAMPPQEIDGFARLIEDRRDNRTDTVDIREMAIAGLDTKWAETRARIVREALAHVECLSDGESLRSQMGFREDDRQEIWMKFHPDDQIMPLGDQEIAMRPSRIRNFPKSISRAVIVENKATFNSYEPLPGVCLFFGSGNAISGTAVSMTFLRDLEVLYWGDLDSFGMKILSRVRKTLPQTASRMMDVATMSSHEALWTHEPEAERFTGEIPDLTQDEEAALDIIRRGHHRLEQERLNTDLVSLADIGITQQKYASQS
jgi:hypothetical protein